MLEWMGFQFNIILKYVDMINLYDFHAFTFLDINGSV